MTVIRFALVFVLFTLISACGNDNAFVGNRSGTRLHDIGYKIKQLAFSWPSVADADTYRLLENPDGVSGYSQIAGDFPATTTSFDYDIAVHLQDWANASYILQSCIGTECTNSAARFATNSGAAIGYFKASNTGVNDRFGHSVAVSDDGHTLAVGAWAEDSDPAVGEFDDSLLDSGAVYVFTRAADGWEGPVLIKASNADSDDQFGYSVALSSDGSTLAVGAWQEAANSLNQSDNSSPGAGAVYVFVRNGVSGTWSQEVYLKAPNAGAGDHFGQSVTLSDDGNTLVVGAPDEDSNGSSQSDNSATNAGAIYTFVRSAGNWSHQAYLKASTAAADEGLGNALSISSNGTVLAAAASVEDDGFNSNNGAVYLFSYGVAWTETAVLRASNAGTNDNFGTSVAIAGDGSTLLVGAPLEDSDGSGVNDNALNSGAAYVFVNNGGWVEQEMLKATVVGAFDQFGLSVAIDSIGGGVLAVGANREDGSATGVGGDPQLNTVLDAGAAYIFTRDAGVWRQHNYLKPTNTGFGDRFGSALAMSADGQTLLLSAIREDSTATGIGGDQTNNSAANAGAVYLY
ncbi:MAG: integrin [Gammaproteobacteria bacterium]|nr:integrin [Gammaproteobacteria bacterium]